MRSLLWTLYDWWRIVAFALILIVEGIRGELKPVKPSEAFAGIAVFAVGTALASWYVKAKKISSPRSF